MRFVCVHHFTIDAPDRDAFEERLHDYVRLTDSALGGLAGYRHGIALGSADAGHNSPTLRSLERDERS